MALSSDGNTALIGGADDNRSHGRGVGVHALGLDLDPAGRKAHRPKKRPAKASSASSVALSADGNTALIGGPGDNGSSRRRVGVHALGLGLDPAGRKAHRRRRERRRPVTASASALSSEGNTALVGGNGDNVHIGAAWALVNPAPIAVTGPASEITQTTATLSATVNPDGGNVTQCTFEYGTGTEYGKTEKCTTLPGSGTSPVAVSAKSRA